MVYSVVKYCLVDVYGVSRARCPQVSVLKIGGGGERAQSEKLRVGVVREREREKFTCVPFSYR